MVHTISRLQIQMSCPNNKKKYISPRYYIKVFRFSLTVLLIVTLSVGLWFLTRKHKIQIPYSMLTMDNGSADIYSQTCLIVFHLWRQIVFYVCVLDVCFTCIWEYGGFLMTLVFVLFYLFWRYGHFSRIYLSICYIDINPTPIITKLKYVKNAHIFKATTKKKINTSALSY